VHNWLNKNENKSMVSVYPSFLVINKCKSSSISSSKIPLKATEKSLISIWSNISFKYISQVSAPNSFYFYLIPPNYAYPNLLGKKGLLLLLLPPNYNNVLYEKV